MRSMRVRNYNKDSKDRGDKCMQVGEGLIWVETGIKCN